MGNKGTFLMATIDVGAHAARMLIAQVKQNHSFDVLENLTQPVPLGSEVFTSGAISAKSINLLCEIFQNFRDKMDEYGVTLYKAIGTSAVREALNSEIFLERIKHASGINLKIFEGSDGARLDYLTVDKDIRPEFDFDSKRMLIADIGAGACQISGYDKGQICFTETIRVGTLRILEEIATNVSPGGMRRTLGPFISKSFSELEHMSYDLKSDGLVAMGSSVRTLAELAGKADPKQRVFKLRRKNFEELYSAVTEQNTQNTENNSYAENIKKTEQTGAIAPCCLILDHLFKLTNASELLIPMTATKDALLLDFISETLDKHDYFTPQILALAKHTASKYKCLNAYSESVVKYAEELFKKTESLHGLSYKELLLLKLAAYLHHVGLFIDNKGYHKHSYYLISSTDFPGITEGEREIVALTARYHRKAFPKPSHIEFTAMNTDQRCIVNKLSALLRLACGMAGTYEMFKKFSLKIKAETVDIKVKETPSSFIDRASLEKSASLFTNVLSKEIVFK